MKFQPANQCVPAPDRRTTFVGWLIAGTLLVGLPAIAADAQPPVYQSPAIHLRTDLDEKSARQLCEHLQHTAGQLVAEFGKPIGKPIDVVVVKSLKNWPSDSIPTDARKQIEARAGTTITERLTEDGKVVSLRSTVYSCADGRTPRHELVHAYCWQTFGRVGPDWFAEGMAELFANRKPGGTGMTAPRYVLDYLRTDPSPPTPAAIVANDLGERKLWQKYAHRWALCYLLSHHPDYSARFQQFARALLQEEDVDFSRTFTGQMEQLGKDYRRFTREVTQGNEFRQH